jgi:hypothetical protein
MHHIPAPNHNPLSLPVGVDIGGLFKDFLSDLSARVFDPSYGLFSVTSDNLLYPNPSAILLYPEPGELEALYGFLGEFRDNLTAFSVESEEIIEKLKYATINYSTSIP